MCFERSDPRISSQLLLISNILLEIFFVIGFNTPGNKAEIESGFFLCFFMEINNIKNKLTSKVKKLWTNQVIGWYQKNKRDLVWRGKENQDFYSIWLSEVMLQQTSVKTVESYFIKFKKKWPDLDSFLNAKLDEILFIWQGMGYYQRAKNIFKTLQILKKIKIDKPLEYDELIKLPGIGTYTAASISAILSDENHAVVDGNIKRIISRCCNINYREKNGMKLLNSKAQELTPNTGNRYYCQSLMDIGSTICKPLNPKCKICPLVTFCDFFINQRKEVKLISVPKRKKIGITYIFMNGNNFFLEKSKDKLLNGLLRFPLSELVILNNNKKIEKIRTDIINNELKIIENIEHYEELGEINHKFSGFDLNLIIVKVLLSNKILRHNGIWLDEKNLYKYPLSKLMVKILEEVLK